MLVFKNILYLSLDLSYYLVKFSRRIFQNKNSLDFWNIGALDYEENAK